MVRDRLANIVESVRESLEAVEVGGDGEITLDERAELDFEVDGTRHLVVEEEVANQHVDIVGGLILCHDDAEDLLADGAIQPGADDEVLPLPLGGAVGLWGLDEDVVGELVFAEEDGDEHALLAVVGLAEVEDDGHVRLDAGHVHGEGGGRGDEGVGRWRVAEGRGHGRGGVGWSRHGGGGVEMGSGGECGRV
jgi:hypothetical protein